MHHDRRGSTWVFDVDGCLIDSMSGTHLRPLAAEVLEALHARSVDVVLWSAGGAEYARRKARGVGIEPLVAAFHAKSQRDARGYWRTDHFLGSLGAATFVDDQPQEVDPDAHVLGVSPYIGENTHDRGLVAVLEAARAIEC